jgi:hypothetical protein
MHKHRGGLVIRAALLVFFWAVAAHAQGLGIGLGADDHVVTGGTGSGPVTPVISQVSGHICSAGLSTSGTSENCTINGTTAGHGATIGIVWCYDASCVTTGSAQPTSFTGATCSLASGTFTSTSSGFSSDAAFCPNLAGGNLTFTVNFSTTVWYITIMVGEFKTTPAHTMSVDTVGNNVTQNGASASPISVSTNGSTAVAGELIYSPAGVDLSSSTLTSGQTALNSPGTNIRDGYQIAGAAGVKTNTFTFTSSPQPYVASVMAIKP